MKKHRYKIFFGAMILGIFATSGMAQRGWEIGGQVGTAFYFGDLNTQYRLNKPGLAASLVGRYNINKRVSFTAQASYAYLSADDAESRNDFERARNLNFFSHNFDLSGVVEFNFLSYTHGSYEEPFTPYLLTGFAIARFSPQGELNGQSYDLRDFGTEGQAPGNEYFKITGSWILGMGFKFDVSPTWSVNIEARMNRMFTDYLDDVSTVYPDKNALQSRRGTIAVQLSDPSFDNEDFPNIGEAGRQRGDKNDNDVFATIKVGMMYYFGRVRCPAISQP